jgi:hypothetical protein
MFGGFNGSGQNIEPGDRTISGISMKAGTPLTYHGQAIWHSVIRIGVTAM